jgi:hypothetical protein
MEKLKRCCDCKSSFDIEEFYKGQSRCKSCTKSRNKVFVQRNPEYFKPGGPGYYYGRVDTKSYNKTKYAQNKEKYLEYNDKFRQTSRGALYNILEGIRCRCKKKGIELDFDLEWMCELYQKQDGKCSQTDLPFDLSENSRRKRFRPLSVSIDRIDSAKGYTKDNVRLVCVAFNLALNAFGDGVFEKIAVGFLKKRNYLIKKDVDDS